MAFSTGRRKHMQPFLKPLRHMRRYILLDQVGLLLSSQLSVCVCVFLSHPMHLKAQDTNVLSVG